MSISSSISSISFPLLNQVFESIDEQVCHIIINGMDKELQLLLKEGLSPNYILQKDIRIKDIIFTKGMTLIFIIFKCCTFFSYPWDLLSMINLLLENKVNLDIEVFYEGKYTNVLDYACENEEYILGDILLTILKASSTNLIYRALDKIKNLIRKDELKQQLYPVLSSSYSVWKVEEHSLDQIPNLKVLELESFFSESCNEKEICESILDGDASKLKELLERGLSPNYVLRRNITVKDFLCKKGTSLLLLALKYCVKRNSSWSLFEVIAILLENNVNLEQPCLGINPLQYVCKNEMFLLEDIVLCLFTSCSKKKVFLYLDEIEDVERRKKLKEKLMNSVLFQFEKEIEEEGFGVEENIVTFSCEETFGIDFELAPVSNIDNENNSIEEVNQKQVTLSNENNLQLEEVLIENAGDKDRESRKVAENFLITSCKNKDIQSCSSSIRIIREEPINQTRVKEIVLQIIKNHDFSILELIVKNIETLKEYDRLFQNKQETLFSTLIEKVCNSYLRHKICSLFLQNKFSPATIVYKGMNLVSFLCFLRCKTKIECRDRVVLMDTICLSLLFSEDNVLIDCVCSRDKETLVMFFVNEKNTFSRKNVRFSEVVSNFLYKPLVTAFIEISTFFGKNIITEEKWEVDTICALLDKVVEQLYYIRMSTIEHLKKKKSLLNVVESLLISSIYCGIKEKESMCIAWIKSLHFPFMSIEVRDEVLALLKKYWHELLDEDSQSKIQQCSSNFYVTSYGDRVDSLIPQLLEDNFQELEGILTNPTLLNSFNQEIKSINDKDSLFSVLIHKIRAPEVRHKICVVFLKYGLKPDEIVYKTMSLIEFLCNIRSVKIRSWNKPILLKTICLVLFFDDNVSLVKKAIEVSDLEDQRKLQNFFLNKRRGRQSRFRSPFEVITEDYYASLTQAFIEACLIRKKNIITGRSFRVEEVLCLLQRLVECISNLSSDKKRSKKILLELFEFLIKVSIHPDLFSKECLGAHRSFIAKMLLNFDNLKNEFFLVKQLWRGTIDEMELDLTKAQLNLIATGSDDTFVDRPSNNIKFFPNISNIDSWKILSDVSLDIAANNFEKLEKILQNENLFRSYENEVKKMSGGDETCFSVLMQKELNSDLRHKIYLLFLKIGYSSEQIVYENMPLVSFLCYLRSCLRKQETAKTASFQSMCLGLLMTKDLRLRNLEIEKSIGFDKKKLVKLFGSENKNACIKEMMLEACNSPVVKAFIEGSVLTKKNILTGDSLSSQEVFSFIIIIIKKLCTFQKESHSLLVKDNQKSFLEVLELLLEASVNLHIVSNFDNDQYKSVIERVLSGCIAPEIKDMILNLLKKHWDISFTHPEKDSQKGIKRKWDQD